VSVARGDCVRAEYFRNNEKSIEIREEAIGNQQSAISNQQSAISNQQSAISNQQSAISNQQSAIGCPFPTWSCSFLLRSQFELVVFSQSKRAGGMIGRASPQCSLIAINLFRRIETLVILTAS